MLFHTHTPFTLARKHVITALACFFNLYMHIIVKKKSTKEQLRIPSPPPPLHPTLGIAPSLTRRPKQGKKIFQWKGGYREQLKPTLDKELWYGLAVGYSPRTSAFLTTCSPLHKKD